MRRPDVRFLDLAHEDASQLSRRALYDAALAMSAWDSGSNHDIGWRLARAAHQLAMAPGTPAAERLALLERAFKLVQEAKAHLRSSPAVYRWSGIILSDLSALQGTKASIEAAFAMRDDWAAAVTLDPSDASAHHLLGRWAFKIVRARGGGDRAPPAAACAPLPPPPLTTTAAAAAAARPPPGPAGLVVPLAGQHLFRAAARVQLGRGAGAL